MNEFKTNAGSYQITRELIPTKGDMPSHWSRWKVNVFSDGKRVNDVSYTITQKEADEIEARTGRNAVDELCRIAEADVIFGKNHLLGPIALQEPSAKSVDLEHEKRAFAASADAMTQFIRLFLPSSENPENHAAQERFNDRRERFARICSAKLCSGQSLHISSLEATFRSFLIAEKVSDAINNRSALGPQLNQQLQRSQLKHSL